MSELHTVSIPAARTIILSDRRDGSTGGTSTGKYHAGDVLPLKVDATRLAGQWLDSVDNITVAGVGSVAGDLDITASDVFEGCALFMVDAADAVLNDTYKISFQLHPTADSTIVDSVEVVIV